MYGIPVTERSLTIEVKLTTITVGSQIVFPDNQIIRGENIVVYGIESFTSTQIATTPAGNSVVTSSGATGLILNFLDDKSINLVNQMPYYALNAASNSGVVREFKPFACVLQKSFVTITNASGLTVNQSAFFNLIYKPLAKK
jgi:hypothetical protein